MIMLFLIYASQQVPMNYGRVFSSWCVRLSYLEWRILVIFTNFKSALSNNTMFFFKFCAVFLLSRMLLPTTRIPPSHDAKELNAIKPGTWILFRTSTLLINIQAARNEWNYICVSQLDHLNPFHDSFLYTFPNALHNVTNCRNCWLRSFISRPSWFQ